jgi:hypothetical protein
MKTDEKVVKWGKTPLVERFGFMLGLLNDEQSWQLRVGHRAIENPSCQLSFVPLATH